MWSNRFLLIFSFMIFLVLTFISCDKGNNNLPVHTYWHARSDNSIQTNDLHRIQEKVPFTIVLPEYLPEEFKDYPPDIWYKKDFFDPDDIRISIWYVTTESPRNILISEAYSPDTIHQINPRPNTEDHFIEITGVEVLETSITKSVDFEDQTSLTVYSYEWILHGIVFSVDIEGYDQSESRRIIESMFE